MNKEEIKEIGNYKKICEIEKLEWFHPNGKTKTILRNDDYFMGIRGDHFVIVYGYCEDFIINDEYAKAFILIANHKGMTIVNYYYENLEGENNE